MPENNRKTPEEILQELRSMTASAGQKKRSESPQAAVKEETPAKKEQPAAQETSDAGEPEPTVKKEWSISWTDELNVNTSAYERYHTVHSEQENTHADLGLTEERKLAIRRKVADQLRAASGQPVALDTPNPDGRKNVPQEKQPPKPDGASTAELLGDVSAAEGDLFDQEAERLSAEKKEADTLSADSVKSQKKDAAPAEKRGVITDSGEQAPPFSYTDFKIKRAGVVRDFFNNMRDFTFTRTNQEEIEMLHMHPQQDSEAKAGKQEDTSDAKSPASETDNAVSRAENLHTIIQTEKKYSFLRFCVTGVLTLLSFLFLTARADNGLVALCGVKMGGAVFGLLQLCVLLAGGALSVNMFLGAWRLIKNKRFGKEVFGTVIYAAGLLYGLFCLIFSGVMQKEYFTSYVPFYLLTVCLYHLGMYLQMRRLRRQLAAALSGGKLQYSLEPLENRFLLQNLGHGAADHTLVVKQVLGDTLAGFENHSFAPDWFDKLSKFITIFLLAAAGIAAIGAALLSSDWMKAVFAFTGAFAFCSPFSAMFAAELPMQRTEYEQREAAQRLGQHYSVLHSDAVELMADAGAVIVGCDALFPPESVLLHGMRPAAGVRVDEAILDAVSILTASESILAPTFLQMIANKTELLKPVDSLTYEDGLGISAWVDNNRVLIGSRRMMENHNILMPSQNIEQAESDKGRMILYLARKGELITAFSLTLHILPQVKRFLGQARAQRVQIYVKSVDCLVENNLIALFGEDADIIGILPSHLHADYDKETHRKDAALSLILSDSSVYSALGALMQLQRLRASLEILRLIVMVLLALTSVFFAASVMAGYPFLYCSAAALIPAALSLLLLAIFPPRS